MPPEPTHPCARCGAPVAPEVGLCERCNPLGLRDVSASQVHGTVFLGVLVAIVVLAVAARLAVAGIGPFPVAISNVVPTEGALAISLTVTNEGTAKGQTTCRVTDPADRGGGTGAFLLSPPIEPGTTITFTREGTAFGSRTGPFLAECRAP